DVEADVGLIFAGPLLLLVVPWTHRPAFAEDLGRHALPDLALRACVGDQRVHRPGEHVDESGRHGEAAGVDDAFRGRSGKVADGRDPVAADPDVGAPARVAGPG